MLAIMHPLSTLPKRTAARKRLRPILLNTATTVVGMIPLYLGGGVMWEPMAVAIIFGLLGATVLTLGVVPVLYAIFFQLYPGNEVKKSEEPITPLQLGTLSN